ncbi:DUF6196 family protein [Trinickia sp. LjRoot230]|uniref:DUF6196 family protein n=1 Tax=Trinickia sp. LjRoot230 TaxID=3342288 RepID=UPI003F50BA91
MISTSFVGWLATHLKNRFGTGVFVTCGQNDAECTSPTFERSPSLDWKPGHSFGCLISAGDSGKSTHGAYGIA